MKYSARQVTQVSPSKIKGLETELYFLPIAAYTLVGVQAYRVADKIIRRRKLETVDYLLGAGSGYLVYLFVRETILPMVRSQNV